MKIASLSFPKSAASVSNTSCSMPRQHSNHDALNVLRHMTLLSTSTAWHQHQGKQIAIFAIKRLTNLPAGWDGEGGSEIAVEAISTATALLTNMPDNIPAPDISPNPNGTVSLIWSLPHGVAEMEIGRTRHSWVLLNREGKASHNCSGDNQVFFGHNQPMADLIRALLPHGQATTPPLSSYSMAIRWNDELDLF
ncbi:MAG TPA: hypothetical protein VLC71_09550 [Thermomonas sp.]|nr:hypothetical protein [Thermomonas sp.]